MAYELDQSDRLLLDMLQKDSRLPIQALADGASLSTASVQRRLKRLRDDGVIKKEVAILDPAALGQAMTFIVLVELERERLDQLQAFRAMANKEPQVQQC